jgi:hypothetical protein
MYVLVVAFFTWVVSLFYLPGLGFTYFIEFGGMNHSRFLPELTAHNHYEMPDSPGYDGQYYAQIAMQPHVTDPVLVRAVDSLPYRARRILFEWTAWALGGGDPIRAMDVYSLQNVACWYLLAALLLRWFPPDSWDHFFRWAAVLFSFGLVFSVRGALLEGPSLLLIAAGVALVESRRPWWGALVLGISGLGRETSMLGASALEPPRSLTRRDWMPWLAKVALVLLPVAAWSFCLYLWLGGTNPAGIGNFSGPFTGVLGKIASVTAGLRSVGHPFPSVAAFDFLVLVGIVAQFLFFAVRVRWRDPWWRVGASYGVLMAFLGSDVWGSYPSAAARVLLPMTLAFNIRAPRGGLWRVLLLVGNLGAIGSVNLLNPPNREEYFAVDGPRELRVNAETGEIVQTVYGARNWCQPERERMRGKSTVDYWRWSTGPCSIAIHNPQVFPIVAGLSFGLATVSPRDASLTVDGAVVWHASLKPAYDNEAIVPRIELRPGDTVLLFESDRPGVPPSASDPTPLVFSIRDLKISLRERR